LIARNVFARLGVVKRIRRIDRPGFQILTDEQYQRLQRCARASRTDSYGLILQGVILAIGEAALRPGEIFALTHSDIDLVAGVLRVRRQIDLDTGVIQWPKDDAERTIVMSPALQPSERNTNDQQGDRLPQSAGRLYAAQQLVSALALDTSERPDARPRVLRA
jgi:integrase